MAVDTSVRANRRHFTGLLAYLVVCRKLNRNPPGPLPRLVGMLVFRSGKRAA